LRGKLSAKKVDFKKNFEQKKFFIRRKRLKSANIFFALPEALQPKKK
jgi:hypothetical protein